MRSFCGGFSSMFCPADFHAFVTSACWPIAAGPSCFLFAGRSYLCAPNSRRQRLRQPRFCGSVLAVKAPCALSSGSQQTSFADARAPRLDALTARSDRSLTPRTAPLPRRDATRVSIPKTILFAGLRAACGSVIFARYPDCRGILALVRFGFATAVTKESAFKPHS